MKIILEHLRRYLGFPADFLIRFIRVFRQNRGNHLAASISFFTLLSLIPFLLLVAAVSGYVLSANRELQQQILSYVSRVIPMWDGTSRRSLSFLEENRGLLGIIGMGAMFATARSLVSSINFAFDSVLDVEERKGSLRLALDTLCVLISVLLLIVGSIMLNVGFEAVMAFPVFENVKAYVERFGGLTRFLSAWFVSALLFFVLYRFLPGRRLSLSVVFFAAVLASGIWEGGKSVFSNYLVYTIDRYRLIYGSISGFIFTVLWSYLLGLSLVTGICSGIVLEQIAEERKPQRKVSEKN